jgi:antitoxin component of MazEF toxin-antitoxin module
MARFREVKKWGNSIVVVLTSVDVSDLNISEGDMIDIEDSLVKQKAKKK